MLGERIKKFIKSHDRLYVIARCIKNINDPNYWKLVKGYYEKCDHTSLLFEHKGEKYPDKIIYHISFYVPDNEKDDVTVPTGFAAFLNATLAGMIFPDTLGLPTVVEWGSNCVYYDPRMEPVTSNVFEYYFEPVSRIRSQEIGDCKNVIDVFGFHHSLINSCIYTDATLDFITLYHLEQKEIEKLADLYKKHIRLNTKTQKYIEDQMKELLDTDPILAVHVRGTDFHLGVKDHPIVVTAEEYIETVKQVYAGGNYKKIFLATDDANVLDLFKGEFKDKLLYYKDTFRSDDHNGAQTLFSDRPFHHYRLGLEALRDIYTLANCDALICGVSNMSYAARYVNIAIDRKFKDIVVLNNGIYSKGSAKSKKYMKMVNTRKKC